MKLYVNGCSHTTGTMLSLKYVEERYSNKLAKMLGGDLITQAIPGASNDKIFRESAIEILRHQPDIAVIQWTDPTRFETPKGSSVPIDKNGWSQHRPISAQWSSRAHENHPYINFYKDCYPSKDRMMQFNQEEKTWAYMVTLDSFIKSLGITEVVHLPYFKLFRSGHRGSLIPQLSELNFLFKDPLRDGMETYLFSQGYDICRLSNDNEPKGDIDGHFMADAHEHLAECLYKNLKFGTKFSSNKSIEELGIQHHYG